MSVWNRCESIKIKIEVVGTKIICVAFGKKLFYSDFVTRMILLVPC